MTTLQTSTYTATDLERLGRKQCVTSLVLGILSILFAPVFLLGLACGIVGTVFAVKGRRRISMDTSYYGMGTAGEVTGIIGIVLGGLSALYWALTFIGNLSTYFTGKTT